MPARRAAASPWTTRADVVAALARRWERGPLPGQVARGEAVVPQQVPIRAPTARQVAERFGDVQEWMQGWAGAGPAIRLEHAGVGGRLVGANQVPVRAWVDDEAQLWRLLGLGRDVADLRAVVDRTGSHEPALVDWVQAHPIAALVAAPVWPRALSVVRWIADQGSAQVYLRQVDVPGVDTKFVETHRTLLAAMLDQVLPADRVDRQFGPKQFSERYGLARKPDYVRLRRLDGEPLLPGSPAELTFRVEDLAAREIAGEQVLIVENEITYLALPALPGTLAILGGGYGVSRLGQVLWLTDRSVLYWGDLDTHGFAILDQLRSVLPTARSVLMDQETLEVHREHRGAEPSPVNARLTRLTAAEMKFYTDLVEGRWGDRVRLEQERVSFAWLCRALADAVAGPG